MILISLFSLSKSSAEQERDDLKKAYKKEKDLRVRARILAVYNEGFKINEAAACLMQCPDWVGIWMPLMASEISHDLQIPLPEMNKIMKQASQTPTTPAILYQQIFQKTVKLHMTYVRELMRKYDLATLIHINAASERWQKNLNRRILCLEAQGFTFVVEDESFFIRDRTELLDSGRHARYSSLVGSQTVTVYGSLVFQDVRSL